VSDREPHPHSWPRQYFDQFRAQASANVHPPGPSGAIRTAVRRQRVRTVAAAVVAAAVVGGLTGYLTRRIGRDGPVPELYSGTASSSPSVAPRSPEATPSAPPSTATTSTPPASPRGSRTPSPAAPAGPVVDLAVSGPSSATLPAAASGYRGTVTITVQNRSAVAAQDTDWVLVTLPLGVSVEFDGQTGFATCLGNASTPTTITWGCVGTPKVGGGGTVTYRVTLFADVAHGPARTIPGFRVEVRPMLRGDTNLDPNMQDNTVPTNLVLPAA
jgi:hypothetical protein